MNGYKGEDSLEDYRRQRLEDPDRPRDFRGGNCFHNGRRLRQSVTRIHNSTRSDVRTSDKITGLVLTKLVEPMLREEPEARLTARMLIYEADQAISNAKTFLAGSFRSSPPGDSGTQDLFRPTSEESQHSRKSHANRGSDASQRSFPGTFFANESRKFYQSPGHTISGDEECEKYQSGSPSRGIAEATGALSRMSMMPSHLPSTTHDIPEETAHDYIVPQRSVTVQSRRDAKQPPGSDLSRTGDGRQSSVRDKQSVRYEAPVSERRWTTKRSTAASSSQQWRDGFVDGKARDTKDQEDPFVNAHGDRDISRDEEYARKLHSYYNSIEDAPSLNPPAKPLVNYTSNAKEHAPENSVTAYKPKPADPQWTRVIYREPPPHLSVANAIRWRTKRRQEQLDDDKYRSYLEARDHVSVTDH